MQDLREELRKELLKELRDKELRDELLDELRDKLCDELRDELYDKDEKIQMLEHSLKVVMERILKSRIQIYSNSQKSESGRIE